MQSLSERTGKDVEVDDLGLARMDDTDANTVGPNKVPLPSMPFRAAEA